MMAAFLPMISMFNKSIEAVSRILYTQQINYLINDLSTSNLAFDRVAIVMSNMVIFMIIFFFAYKAKSLAE
jgi:ABC-2 type transport system permease protein